MGSLEKIFVHFRYLCISFWKNSVGTGSSDVIHGRATCEWNEGKWSLVHQWSFTKDICAFVLVLRWFELRHPRVCNVRMKRREMRSLVYQWNERLWSLQKIIILCISFWKTIGFVWRHPRACKLQHCYLWLIPRCAIGEVRWNEMKLHCKVLTQRIHPSKCYVFVHLVLENSWQRVLLRFCVGKSATFFVHLVLENSFFLCVGKCYVFCAFSSVDRSVDKSATFLCW